VGNDGGTGDLRPILFLDVDGVVSPIAGGHLGPLPTTWESWRKLRWSLPAWTAPDCVSRLTALPVERIWCSTWGQMVDGERGLSGQLGWSGMRWLRLPPGDRPWSKRRAIEGWFAESGTRAFIWADNDLRLDSSGRPWAQRLSVPSLLIRPHKNVGLTPRHLEAMERWVGDLGAPGSAGP
jgi:hypothetical protein